MKTNTDQAGDAAPLNAIAQALADNHGESDEALSAGYLSDAKAVLRALSDYYAPLNADEDAHSPLPWTTRQSFANRWQIEVTQPGYATQTIGAIYAETGSYATCAANAAFIVKACNEYATLKAKADRADHLVGALEGLFALEEHGFLLRKNIADCAPEWDAARAALHNHKESIK